MVTLVDGSAIVFLVALIVSTVIIYLVTDFLHEKRGFGTAIGAAIIGTVIYTLAYYFLGGGIIAALLGGIVWLFALRGLYNLGWMRALLTAVAIWIVAAVISLVLPTLAGPL